jgi:hypothetical protein
MDMIVLIGIILVLGFVLVSTVKGRRAVLRIRDAIEKMKK